MKCLQDRIDYSLEGYVANDDQSCENDAPRLATAVKIEVESPELRCMKGDCQGDYAPG